jgi:superfamily I DNA and/or RNA helicase
MINPIEYFEELRVLLQLEKDEEMRQFDVMMRGTTVQQRVELGHCWFPLRVVETGYGFGDYPFVIVERTKQKDRPHSFSAGKLALVFSSENDSADAIKGAIQFVNGDQMKLIFFCDELPEVLDYGRLGINSMPDENAYREQEHTMKLVANARNCRLAVIREALLLNKLAESDDDVDIPELPEHLNQSQQAAVKLILESEDVCLLHGPPGTGKTTTLIAAAKILVEQGEQILLCAPSNAAADWLTQKSLEAGMRVLRIGNIARINETLEASTVEGQVRQHPQYSDIKEFRKRAAELRRMAGKYKRQFGHAEREQRKLILSEAKSIAAEARKLESFILETCVDKAEVITCTLVGANHSLLEKRTFSTVFIDEAAQAPEPGCWIPISKADRVVLAGDPFQLPPTVKSQEAARKGLSITLMEKVLDKVPTALLTMQYRMNEQIMSFPNKWFYQGRLEAHADVANWYLGSESVMEFIDTAGLGWEEQINPETQSISNAEEARFLWQRLIALAESIHNKKLSIGVISPYRGQVGLLNELGIEWLSALPSTMQIEVQTIDSFQGQERDAIYVSLVRSNDRSEIGFLQDYRRINVAMTRARKKLVLIGDSATLGHDPFYKALIEHCELLGVYKSAWEFIN